MKIHESCVDWHLDYTIPAMADLDPESQEFKTLTSVLHLAGDVIASYNNIPKDISPDIKTLVLDSLAVIFTDTKEQVVTSINNAISMHALNTPLDKGYSEEEIFGTSLVDKFITTLDSVDELKVAAEHFHVLQDGSWEDEEDDDADLV